MVYFCGSSWQIRSLKAVHSKNKKYNGKYFSIHTNRRLWSVYCYTRCSYSTLLSAICCCQCFYCSSCDKLFFFLSCRISHRLLGPSASALHNISPSKSFHISLTLVWHICSQPFTANFTACLLVLISTLQSTLPSHTPVTVYIYIIVNHFNWSCI